MAQDYPAIYSTHFQRDLEELSTDIQRRILREIETKLLKDPYQYARKLKGANRPGRWKFRVGDYRIRFDMEGTTLLFHKVRHRREIYER